MRGSLWDQIVLHVHGGIEGHLAALVRRARRLGFHRHGANHRHRRRTELGIRVDRARGAEFRAGGFGNDLGVLTSVDDRLRERFAHEILPLAGIQARIAHLVDAQVGGALQQLAELFQVVQLHFDLPRHVVADEIALVRLLVPVVLRLHVDARGPHQLRIHLQLARQLQHRLDRLGDLGACVVEFRFARLDAERDRGAIRLGPHFALTADADRARLLYLLGVRARAAEQDAGNDAGEYERRDLHAAILPMRPGI
jgi:hypothetical protein